MNVECDECGYVWDYSGDCKRTNCSKCGTTVKTGVKQLSTTDYFKEYQMLKQDLDGAYESIYDELTGQGKGPAGVRASIEYLKTDKTQKEVAKEYDVTANTIRELHRKMSSCDVWYSNHDEFDRGLHEIIMLYDTKALQYWAAYGEHDTDVDGTCSMQEIAEAIVVHTDVEKTIEFLERAEKDPESVRDI